MNTIERKEFVSIWKNISNDERRKPSFEEVKFARYDWSTKKTIHYIQKVKNKGFIEPEHHILYNLVRGLPLDRGFKEGSEGFLNALDFFKNKPTTYRQNMVYKSFKDIMPNDQYCAMIEEAIEMIKQL